MHIRGASCDHTGGGSFSIYMAMDNSDASSSKSKFYQVVKRQDIANNTGSSQEAIPHLFLPSPDTCLSENGTDKRESSTAMGCVPRGSEALLFLPSGSSPEQGT